MRRLTFLAAALALVATAAATPVRAQVAVPLCVTCSSGLDANGQPYCTISPAQQGWSRCSCTPYCNCGGICITAQPDTQKVAPDRIAADARALERIPATGAVLASAPAPTLLASLDHGRYFGETLDYAYFASNYALLHRPDGSWRMFRLEPDGSVVMRDCNGAYTGRLYRSKADEARNAPALTLASL